MPGLNDSASTPRQTNGLTTASVLRLLLINGVAGAVLGLGFVAGVLLLDIASIRTMLTASGEWIVSLALLSMGSMVTFSSVAMGGAIMLLPKDKNGPTRPSRPLRALVPIPVRAKARTPRHPAN